MKERRRVKQRRQKVGRTNASKLMQQIVQAMRQYMKMRSLKSLQLTVTRKIDKKTGLDNWDVSTQASDTEIVYDPETKQRRMIEGKESSKLKIKIK